MRRSWVDLRSDSLTGFKMAVYGVTTNGREKREGWKDEWCLSPMPAPISIGTSSFLHPTNKLTTSATWKSSRSNSCVRIELDMRRDCTPYRKWHRPWNHVYTDMHVKVEMTERNDCLISMSINPMWGNIPKNYVIRIKMSVNVLKYQNAEERRQFPSRSLSLQLVLKRRMSATDDAIPASIMMNRVLHELFSPERVERLWVDTFLLTLNALNDLQRRRR